jgi:XTP/dITP diphosphohydrolase
MPIIYFATTNAEKIQIAQTACTEFNISLHVVDLAIDEIQGEDPGRIVRDKVSRAYAKVNNPVVVSDDSWDIKALNGFPGPYMKSINHWFKPDDFLRLMDGIEDRTIVLHQLLAYTDGKTTKIFKNDIYGKIIDQVRGAYDKSPNMTVIALDEDNGKTLAEVFERSKVVRAERYQERHDVWLKFIHWYKQL